MLICATENTKIVYVPTYNTLVSIVKTEAA